MVQGGLAHEPEEDGHNAAEHRFQDKSSAPARAKPAIPMRRRVPLDSDEECEQKDESQAHGAEQTDADRNAPVSELQPQKGPKPKVRHPGGILPIILLNIILS